MLTRSTLTIVAVMALGAVMLTSAATVPADRPLNPYARLAEKNIAGLSRPDQTLDFDLTDDVTAFGSPAAQSKTCSQRCSTTCSASCTTTRGCSSNCKRQTDGCSGGGVSTPRPAPAPATSAVLPSASLKAIALPTDVIVDTGPRATALYHRDTCPLLVGASRQAHTLTEAQKRYYQPHCLCITGNEGLPETCAAAVEALKATAATPSTSDTFSTATPLESASAYFTLGSRKDAVRALQGPPTSVIGNRWRYENSMISFQGDSVVGYSNISNNLKVSLGSRTNSTGYIGVGSTKAEVLAVHGTPTSVIGNSWRYENSMISFDGDKLNGYANVSNNLRVR